MRPLLVACACSLAVSCTSERSPAPPPTPLQGSAPSPSTTVVPTAPADRSASLATGHPRIWITAADLPRLRGWANPQNPVWAAGIVPALQQALTIYDKEFFPGGQPNPSWPDPGTSNWVPRSTEALAEFFAFLSLVDPNPAARAAHGDRARKLLMHAIHEADKGPDPDPQSAAPFRVPAFATYNRASEWGEAFGLTVDWIYPLLSADDKASIRRVFLRWADDNLHAATSGDEHPQPIGVVNDPRLLADGKRLRWAVNNYFTVHMRQLVLYGLCLDEADDPPLDPAAPAGRIGNTLRSYLDDAIGAWLYQQYAVYEDPAVSAPALGVPTDGLGVASGGLSAEGFLYGMSLGALHEALLGLYTAGYRDPRAFGPQIRLIDSGFWDRFTDGMLHSLVAEPQIVPAEAYVGPVYQVAAYGDVQRLWLTPDYATPFLSLAVHAAAEGNTAQVDKARWIAVNATEGTAPGLAHRVAGIWGNSRATLAILHFLALDPARRPAPDPRPVLPTTFFDRAIGRVIARTAWGPEATAFDYKCSWETIGHQFGDCNQFELWRKGEWLVRERTGYSNDPGVITSEYHNTLALQNKVTSGADKPHNLQWFEEGTWARGGQFTLGMNAGDPTVSVSIGPGWVHAQADATTLYNRPSAVASDAAVDVVHASRSIAWLKPDVIVVYDRATTRSDKLFKRFHLVSGGDAEVSGKLATFTTPKGQKLYLHSLLPPGAVLTAGKAEPFNGVATGEPSRSKLRIEDPASPRDIRFLDVLEGADSGATPAAVSAVRSVAGTPFEGAAVGGLAAMFPVDLAVPFTRVTYSVPARVTAQIVGGLRPGAAYDVTLAPANGTVEVTIAPGSTYVADEGGVLAIGGFATKKP
jgi:hypothetical protein